MAVLTDDNHLLSELIKNSLQHKAVSVFVRDFMCFGGEAEAFYDERNILNLVGYNDSGKTAFTVAQEILYVDTRGNKQVKMIHDGKQSFLVGNRFTDGVVITKEKFLTGQSIWTFEHEGKILYTNKRDTAVIATDGVPAPIAAYLKVAIEETTKELVNFRRNTDRLFLTHTSNSDNTKIINGLLSLDVVMESISRLNKEKNRLTAELGAQSAKVVAMENEAIRTVIISEDVTNRLSDCSEKAQKSSKQAIVIDKLSEDRKIMEENRPFKELVEVSTEQAEQIIEVYNLREQINTPVQPELIEIDTDKIESILTLTALRKEVDTPIQPELIEIDTQQIEALFNLENIRSQMELPIPPELEEVDTTQIVDINNLIYLRSQMNVPITPSLPELTVQRFEDITEVEKLANEYKKATVELSNLDKEIEQVQEEIAKLAEVQNMTICKNCGMLAV